MEPYLFRQMLLEHIIPEIQSERNSMIYAQSDSNSINESEKLNIEDDEEDEEDEESEGMSEGHSLNSLDMENGPISPLIAVNDKRVKFAWEIIYCTVIWNSRFNKFFSVEKSLTASDLSHTLAR